MKYIIWILILSFLLSGCYSSNSYVINRAQIEKPSDKINYKGKNKTVHINLLDGTSFMGKNMIIREDSTKWLTFESDSIQSAATSNIKEITIERRNVGKGTAQGFLIGTILGIIIGVAAGSDCSDPSLDGGDFCIGKKDLTALGVVFVESAF